MLQWFLGILLPVTVIAEPAERVALVIGIASYSGDLKALGNPVRDSELIAQRLAANGFSVTIRSNLDHADFQKAVDDFASSTQGARQAVIFYAGHGMTVMQDNRLVNALAPINAQIDCETRKAQNVVAMESVLDRLKHIPNKVVIFDACRSNPFSSCSGPRAGGSGFQAATTSSQTSRGPVPLQKPTARNLRGFEPVGPGTAATSLLIGYSSDLGGVARDGEPGGHSPFVEAFVSELDRGARVPFRELLDRTSRHVAELTKNFQVPWVVTLGGEPEMCLFNGKCELRGEVLKQKQLAESRKLAVLASDALTRGDVDSALALALEGLPDTDSTDPADRSRAFAIETHAVLERASRRGERQLVLKAHESDPLTIAFSPDGKRLISSGYEPYAMLWDPIKGRSVAKLSIAPDPYVISRISRTGKYVAALGAAGGSSYSYGGKKVVVWDAVDGKRILDIAATDTNSGLPDAPEEGSGAEIVDFVGDDLVLVGESKGIAIWSVSSKKRVGVIPSRLSGYVRAFGVPEIDRVALLQSHSGAEGNRTSRLELWSLDDPKRVASITPHTGDAEGAQLAERARLLVTGSRDGTVRAWDMLGGERRFDRQLSKPVVAVAVPSDGSIIAAVTDNKNTPAGDVAAWDLQTGSSILYLANVVARGGRSVSIDADGKRLFAAGFTGTALVCDLMAKRIIARIKQPSLSPRLEGGVVGGVFSPDGEWIATGGDNGEIMLRRYEIDTSEPLTATDEKLAKISRLSFVKNELSNWTNERKILDELTGDLRTTMRHGVDLFRLPSSTLVVTHSNDGPVRLWDRSGGALLLEEKLDLEWLTGVALDETNNQVVLWHSAQNGSETTAPQAGDAIQRIALLSDVKETVKRARPRLAACLPVEQRVAAGLSPEKPGWCQRLGVKEQEQQPLANRSP